MFGPSPLNRACNRDPHIKAARRRGSINHGYSLSRQSHPEP